MSVWQRFGDGLSSAGVARAGPIGLELTSSAIHLAQLGAGRAPELRANASVPYEEGRAALLEAPEKLRALLRGVLHDEDFSGRRVVSALPSGDVKVMLLNYTLERGQDEPPIILRHVEERTGDNAEDLVVDYLPIRMIGEEGGDRSALVAVSRREVAIRQLEALRRAGLQVEALEIVPVAVRRLALYGDAEAVERNQLIVYCGPDRSHLSVLWGRRWALYREFDFGEDAIVATVAKALELDEGAASGMLRRYGVHPPAPNEAARADIDAAFEFSQTLMEIVKPSFYALAEQVSAALVYMASKFRGASPDRLELVGGMTRWAGADRLLEGLVEIPVGVLSPGVVSARGAGGCTSEQMVATGLALRGMVGDG